MQLCIPVMLDVFVVEILAGWLAGWLVHHLYDCIELFAWMINSCYLLINLHCIWKPCLTIKDIFFCGGGLNN